MTMIFSRRMLFLFLRTCSVWQSPNALFSSSLRFPTTSFFFSSSSATDSSSPKRPLVVDYLINSVGISPEQAIKASTSLSRLQSTSKPDAVRQFLKESGFSDEQIKNIILKSSRVLMKDVDTLLKPRLEALKELDFSESDIIRLVSSKPIFLFCHDNLLKNINFWRNFLQSNDLMLNALLRGRRLIFSRPDSIMPKVQFLNDCGMSMDRIAYMISIKPNVISMGLDTIKHLVKRVEELQIPCGSKPFSTALVCISQISRATMDAKLKLFRNLGCSEPEISLAISKFPQILQVSEKKLKDSMVFFVENVGFEPSYVMERPQLLSYSLEKRLIPRYHLLKFLESKRLPKKYPSLCTVAMLTEKTFVEKFIVQYQDEMPELHQVYAAALAGSFIM